MTFTVTVRRLTGLRSCGPNFGIDIRTPAFDRRVVEFCIGIPEDQYLRKGCDRWLIRRAMKGRLPDAVLYKKKRGVQAADWYPRLTRERDHIAKKVKSLAANADVASIIDLQRLTAILDKWPEREPSDFSPEAGIHVWPFRKLLERHISSRT